MNEETNNTTMLANLIDPEVMADMITAKLPSAIKVSPFAKIDTTLVGRAGSTITVPRYEYIGDAETVAEGIEAGTAQLTTDSEPYEIKKIVKDVEITDEAALSGYGNPVGEINSQLVKAIASKIDADCMDALQDAQVAYDANGIISYNGIVEALDLFQEEENVDKVMFVAPTQVSELRKDANFISNDKYNNNVIMKGEIGMVANTRIVPSKKVVKGTDGKFHCPIVQLRAESETGDDELAALTIFLKRDTNVETQRIVKGKKTLISADKHYVAALTDESKVVIAKFTAPAGE